MKTVWGIEQTEAWWHGDTSLYTAAAASGSSVSRFMPGVTAPGATEDLNRLPLRPGGITSIQINPGLWYEHRRDSHGAPQRRRKCHSMRFPGTQRPGRRMGRLRSISPVTTPGSLSANVNSPKMQAKRGSSCFIDLYNTHNVLLVTGSITRGGL